MENKRRIGVKAHKRYDPRINKKIDVDSYDRYQDIKPYRKSSKEQERKEKIEKLQKQLDQHWKDTEQERKRTHTSKIYESFLKKQEGNLEQLEKERIKKSGK